MYEEGDGVDSDLVQAYKWYALAAAHGFESGTTRRDFIAEQLIPVQLFDAQQLAREWKPASLEEEEISPFSD